VSAARARATCSSQGALPGVIDGSEYRPNGSDFSFYGL
jgi:hypothetical protein